MSIPRSSDSTGRARDKISSARPYRLFDLSLLRKKALSPHLSRLTFTGGEIGRMRSCAPDQRIKVFFPGGDGRSPSLPPDGNWLAAYQAMPPDMRPARRTYTIRALRPDELDIDFVLHGETGPASRWATRAEPGVRVQIAAPDNEYDGDPGGYEWRPPQGVRRVLLIADETALPAASGILEAIAAMRERPTVEAWFEVPTVEDCIGVSDFPELRLEWLPRRESDAHGSLMIEAAGRTYIPSGKAKPNAFTLPDVDVDRDILWDRATSEGRDFYVWAAGEAQAVKDIRKILLNDRGVDRAAANLMGYWRSGREMD